MEFIPETNCNTATDASMRGSNGDPAKRQTHIYTSASLDP